MSVASIETGRLVLLPFDKETAASALDGTYRAFYRMGLTIGEGWPNPEALPKILPKLLHMQEPTGFETWMIVKKDGMAVIGEAGFKGLPGAKGEVDIGYGISPSERRKGYTSEAVQGLIDWAFAQPNVRAVTADCLIRNEGSVGVLRKLQFAEVARDAELIYWKLRKGT